MNKRVTSCGRVSDRYSGKEGRERKAGGDVEKKGGKSVEV